MMEVFVKYSAALMEEAPVKFIFSEKVAARHWSRYEDLAADEFSCWQ